MRHTGNTHSFVFLSAMLKMSVSKLKEKTKYGSNPVAFRNAVVVYVIFMVTPWLCLAEEANNVSAIFRDEGENVTLLCPDSHKIVGPINWIISDASTEKGFHSSLVRKDGSLYLANVSKSDSHLYTCQDSETNQSLGSIKLVIRSVPPAVSNLTVITHSVYALVTWKLQEDGGYPIEKFVLKYRLDESHSNLSSKHQWKIIDDLQPNTSSVDVFQLMPNSTYYFRIQAVNRLGLGQEISVMAKTKYDPEEIKRAKELLSVEVNGSSSVFMKVTIVAICLIVITFSILALGISLVLFRNCGQTGHSELNCEATEEEVMELVPHITLNPSFNIDMLEYIEAEVSPTDAGERTNLVQSSNLLSVQ